MTRVLVKFGYIGKGFECFPKEPERYSVVGTLLETIELIGRCECTKVVSASRTDKGVSALANAIAFSLPSNTNIVSVLNGASSKLKRKNIYLHAYCLVDEDFNPRYRALWREYIYFLPYKVIKPFDVDLFNMALKCFNGTHDFRYFCKTDKTRHLDPILHLETSCTIEDSIAISRFKANHFLWHMIRKIIWAAVMVARGKMSIDDIKTALKGQKIRYNMGLAPSEYLLLWDVKFDANIEKTIKPIGYRGIAHELELQIAMLTAELKLYSTILNYFK